MRHRHTRKRTATWAAAVGVGLAGVLAATLAPSALAQTKAAGGASAAASAAIPVTDTVRTAVLPRVAAIAPALRSSSAAVQQFWTPARLAAATPEDATAAPTTASKNGVVADRTVQTLAQATSSAVGHSYYNARPSIGIIVYADKDMKTHYCTASVVQSRTKNLIMMAAHCRPGSWMAFVPDYRSGAKTQPYGIWAVTSAYTDTRYRATGAGTEYDYAFAKVAPDSKGRLLQNVTNGNVLTRTPGYRNWAGLTGYPGVASAPADKAITCWNWTSKVPGYTQMQFLCTGYYAGTSGSPWLINLNLKTNTGDVIGLIGGLDYGGPNSWINYSPIFDNRIFGLYAYAVAH